MSFCPVFLISFLLFFLPFILFPSLVLSSFNFFFFLIVSFYALFLDFVLSSFLPYSFIFLILYFFLPSISLSFYPLDCLSSFVYSFLYSFLPSRTLFMFFLPSVDHSSRDLYKQYSCTLSMLILHLFFLVFFFLCSYIFSSLPLSLFLVRSSLFDFCFSSLLCHITSMKFLGLSCWRGTSL